VLIVRSRVRACDAVTLAGPVVSASSPPRKRRTRDASRRAVQPRAGLRRGPFRSRRVTEQSNCPEIGEW
jgi:hypothetical protein